MLGAPYNQLREIGDLGYNVERQTRFPNMKLDHKFFEIVEKVDWEVLKVCTGHNWVRDLPLLVYEQVFLGVTYTMHRKSHVNRLRGFHNECRIDTNMFDSNGIEKESKSLYNLEVQLKATRRRNVAGFENYEAC